MLILPPQALACARTGETPGPPVRLSDLVSNFSVVNKKNSTLSRRVWAIWGFLLTKGRITGHTISTENEEILRHEKE
jgi:hypothetical protein